MVLVGVQPSLMQVPPTCLRSTRTVRKRRQQAPSTEALFLTGADDNRLVLIGLVLIDGAHG